MQKQMNPLERKKLVTDNLKLAEVIAREQSGQKPFFCSKEINAYAYLGLIDASNKFNPDKNVSFRTYARYRIFGAILDGFREYDWLTKQQRKKVKNNELIFQLLSIDHIYDNNYHGNKLKQLEKFDFIEYESIFEAFEKEETRNILFNLINSLDKRTKHCFIEYFYKDKTMIKISKEIHLSESRISQIITKGLKIIKKKLEINKKKDLI
jgi:RNA polymerase sigma factor for flagellar operon FliA